MPLNTHKGGIMRRTIAAAVILAASLTACGNGDDGGDNRPQAAAAKPSVDCSDDNLSQADWIDHCGDQTTAPAEQPSSGLTFGKTYRWPDGLEVSVASVKQVTKFGEYDNGPGPGDIGFRVSLKLSNKGKAPAALDDLSVITEGATNGGEAASAAFDAGSEPLEGRLAPGVTVTKNDDEVLGKKFGRNIVVTVQRSSENFDLEFPEFTGSIE